MEGNCILTNKHNSPASKLSRNLHALKVSPYTVASYLDICHLNAVNSYSYLFYLCICGYICIGTKLNVFKAFVLASYVRSIVSCYGVISVYSIPTRC